MKKPFRFHELSSTIKCIRCGRTLKENVIARKKPKNRQLCYRCEQMLRKINQHQKEVSDEKA